LSGAGLTTLPISTPEEDTAPNPVNTDADSNTEHTTYTNCHTYSESYWYANDYSATNCYTQGQTDTQIASEAAPSPNTAVNVSPRYDKLTSQSLMQY